MCSCCTLPSLRYSWLMRPRAGPRWKAMLENNCYFSSRCRIHVSPKPIPPLVPYHISPFSPLSSNDPILMRKSPEVLRISRWLETLAGRRMAYGFVSIAPVCALVLDMTNHPETAMEVIATGVILLGGACMPAIFWVCGRSLIRAIDASILQQQQDVSAANGKRHEAQDSKQRSLMRARQKVQTIVMVAFFVCGKVTGLLLFAVCSKYGTAVPLLLYAPPLVYVPPLWSMLHIQLHAGRTKLSSDGNGLTSTPFNMFSLSAISIWRSRVVQSGVINRVVPDEVSP